MPQTYPALRKKFWVGDDTGEKKAEGILRDAGFIEQGFGRWKEPETWDIKKQTIGDIRDAWDYLVEEWDYDIHPDPEVADAF